MRTSVAKIALASIAALLIAGCGSTHQVKTVYQSGPSTSSSQSLQKSVKHTQVNIAQQNLTRTLAAMTKVSSLTVRGVNRTGSTTNSFTVSSAANNSCQGQINSQKTGSVNFIIISNHEYINAGIQFWKIGLPSPTEQSIIPKIANKWVSVKTASSNEFTSTCTIVQSYKTNYLLKRSYSGVTNLKQSSRSQIVGVRSSGVIFTIDTVSPYYLVGIRTNISNFTFSNYNKYSSFSPPAHSKSLIVTN